MNIGTFEAKTNLPRTTPDAGNARDYTIHYSGNTAATARMPAETNSFGEAILAWRTEFRSYMTGDEPFDTRAAIAEGRR
jgi:hypothetical protein